MSIRLATSFSASVMPTNDTYQTQIADLVGLVGWWQSGTGETVTAGGVSIWNDRFASIPGYSGESGKRPVSTLAAVGSERGLVFDGVNDYVAIADGCDRGSAFSWAMICKAAAPGADAYLASTFESVGTGTMIYLRASDAKVGFAHGNGVTFAPMAPAAPMIIIGGFSNYYIGGRVNGADMARTSSNNSEGVQTITLGGANVYASGPAAFALADFLTFQRDITLDGAVIALLEGYARDVYGCVIA